jgi:PAS domain S-box-containing protein
MSKQHEAPPGATGPAAESPPADLPEELRELLAAALCAANEAVSITVAGVDEPQLVFVNAAYTHLTGYAAHEAVGQPARLFDHPKIDRRTLAGLRAEMAAGRSVQCDLPACRKDGSEVWLAFRAAPIRDRAGQVTHFITTQRDISARRASQEAAERSSMAKSLFLSRISHELLTPLNSLIGFPEMLVDGHFGALNDGQRQAVTNILEAAEQLRRLLRDLLDLTRLESGRLQLDRAPFDLGVLLADLAGPVVEAARRKGLTLEVDVARDLPQVEGDPLRLKQVALNLLDNAVKYTSSGGWIKLRAWAEQPPAGAPPLVRLAVADSGIGIRQEDHERLFRMFEQADSSLTRHQPGTGLGLALVRRLVALHGGRAWVESGGEGQGSTFHVEIPGLRPEASGKEAAGNEAAASEPGPEASENRERDPAGHEPGGRDEGKRAVAGREPGREPEVESGS